MRLLTSGLAAIALAAASGSAAAEIPVSPLGDIYATFNDCLAVAGKDGLSTAKLAELGWVRGVMTDKDNKPLPNSPLIYGNPKRKPLILLSSESGEGMCMVTARLESAATFPEFLKAWGGKLPPPSKDGTIGFYDEGHPVVIRRTGTTEKPSLTMSVMTPGAKQ